MQDNSGSINQQIQIGVCPRCSAIFELTAQTCDLHNVPLRHETIIVGGGKVAQKYDLMAVIGRGGMSTVFRANDKDGKQCAIKVLDSEFVTDVAQRKRFQQEAEILSRLSHPNIVSVYDFDVTDLRPYIAMEFVEGPPLSRLLDAREEFPLYKSVRILKQTCDGMAHAHAHGVIHRDLKPGNLLVDRTSGRETVQIIDFGVAKYFGSSDEDHETTGELGLTRNGEVLGTSLYMSPEQAVGREPDPRSDVYSLGCIMYELIAGAPPFQGRTALEILHKQINAIAVPVNTLPGRSNVPPQLVRIVKRAIEKRPEDRFQNMIDMLRSLDSVVVY
jgi:eukaryotic-like serine/threonine-protein kinase